MRSLGSPVAAVFRILREYSYAIVIAAVVALVLRVFVVEAFRIPGDFMAPSLLAGDHIFVVKPRFLVGDVRRGDVVVFSLTNDPTKEYIKRVVALGGDRILIKDGALERDGTPIGKRFQANQFEETRDGGGTYLASWEGVAPSERNLIPVTVPQQHVFVLSDQRSRVQDSRSWGFIPVSQIKGRAALVWFSAGLDGIRWDRFFSRVR